MKKILILFLFVLTASGAAYFLTTIGDITSTIITERFQYDQELGLQKDFDPPDGRILWEGEREETSGKSSSIFIKLIKKYGPVLFIPILLIAIVWYFRSRKKAKPNEHNEKEALPLKQVEKEEISLEQVGNEEPQSIHETKVVQKQHLHKIRGLLKNWESSLNSIEKKRENETIREWFQRINGPEEIIPIYEKVRYGEEECTEAEYNSVLKKLN
ncbi:hypothetical protein ACOJQI_11980 [Bacillus salacetis]|uniref:hypothetical protein n=1 Tax=Bacillus salacetis TaxID=2315464 RepID=UPI003B9F977E